MIKKEGGFTLIEIVMTMVILSILGIMSFGFIADTSKIFGSATKEGRLFNELWVTMEKITRDAAYATAVNSPATGTTGATLNFDKGACNSCLDLSTNVIFFWNGVGNQQLYRTGDTTGQMLLADGITDFSVTSDGTYSYLTVTITKTDPNGSNALTLKTTIYYDASVNANTEENVL